MSRVPYSSLELEYETTEVHDLDEEDIEVLDQVQGPQGTQGRDKSNSSGSYTLDKLDPSHPEYVIKFIRRVKSLPLLYNQEDENFRNIPKKQQAWIGIATEFKQEVNWCRTKWVSLRDYFVKRKKLVRRGKPARPWIYYTELSFLNFIYGEDHVPIDSSEYYLTLNSINSNSGSGSGDYQSQNSIQLGDSVEIIDNEGEEDNQEEIEEEQEFQFVNVPKYEEEDDPVGKGWTSSFGPKGHSLINGYGRGQSSSSGGKRRKLDINASVFRNARIPKIGKTEVKLEMESEREDFRGPIPEVSLDTDDEDGQNVDVNNSMREDSYGLFCLSVAAQLRNMQREKALRLQVQIMNLIYESEFPGNKC